MVALNLITNLDILLSNETENCLFKFWYGIVKFVKEVRQALMEKLKQNTLFFPVVETSVPETKLLNLIGFYFGGMQKPSFIEKDFWIQIPSIYTKSFDQEFKKILEIYGITKIICNHSSTHLRLVNLGYTSMSDVKLTASNPSQNLNKQKSVLISLIEKISRDLDLKEVEDISRFLSLFMLTESIPGGSNFEKMMLLYLLSSQINNGLMVEVGVMFGKSSIPITIAASESNSKFLAVDTWSDEEVIQHTAHEILKTSSLLWDKNLMHEVADQIIHLFNKDSTVFQGDSKSAVKKWVAEGKITKNSVTFLHVDANHDYDKIMEDVICWAPYLSEQNIVIFDDTDWSAGDGPRKIVDFLKDNAKYKKLIDYSGSTIFWNLDKVNFHEK
jgi:hypothetical protein